MRGFSPARFMAIVGKEFVQMRRDRLTFAMLVGIPLIQLVLFGYAINADPRHLPTAVLSADNSPYSRAIVAAMRNSDYFAATITATSREDVRLMLLGGEAQFAVTFPEHFGRDLVRGLRPVLLVEADATDPVATGGALKNLQQIVDNALAPLLTGPLAHLARGPSPVTLRTHAEFNPEAETQYNIVPGLMGTILTLTLVMITSLAMTRERERGTMENLLTTPVRPLEVTVGKILPFVMVGYLQVALILAASAILFSVPMHGSVVLLLAFTVVFIGANLSVGVTISTVAQNQLQALQMSVFFFLPSLLLSGFLFPFRGMPEWAQWIGSVLPLTHYLRLVRGILLKGNGLADSLPHAWPVLVFWVVVVAIGLKGFRKTLD
ncbi:MAG: ABC transporter permease [Desulfovibrionaceae bacterium]